MKKLSEKETIIQDALGTLPKWNVTFKVKISKDTAHWASESWESSYYHTYSTLVGIMAADKKSARKKGIKMLKKNSKPSKVKFRTYFIAEK